jgi:hypothetical protein
VWWRRARQPGPRPGRPIVTTVEGLRAGTSPNEPVSHAHHQRSGRRSRPQGRKPPKSSASGRVRLPERTPGSLAAACFFRAGLAFRRAADYHGGDAGLRVWLRLARATARARMGSTPVPASPNGGHKAAVWFVASPVTQAARGRPPNVAAANVRTNARTCDSRPRSRIPGPSGGRGASTDRAPTGPSATGSRPSRLAYEARGTPAPPRPASGATVRCC